MTNEPEHPYKKNARGRKKIFKNVKDMQKAIDDYFNSCWEYKPIIGQFGLIKDPLYDPTKKHRTLEAKAKAQYIHKWQLVRVPSIEDLALALGMTSRSLLNYEKEETFFPTIERAKEIVKSEIVQSSYDKNMSKGAIWNLMQNFNQSDKKTIASESVITIGGEDYDAGEQ